jgi:hypothetical protein
MRHEYHEVTDTDEIDLGDGRMLIVERHRRRRMKVPSVIGSGAPAAPNGPGRVSAWIVLGTLGLLIAYGCYSTVSSAYSRELVRIRSGIGLSTDSCNVTADGTMTFTYKGKQHTLRPGDKHYEEVRQQLQARLAEGPPEPLPQTAPPPPAQKPKPDAGPRLELKQPYPLKLNSGTTP